MLERHASTVLGVMASEVASAKTELVMGRLPNTCLTRLAQVTSPSSGTGALNRSGFRYSPDYRSVTCGDEAFTLTPRQAQVVQLLYEAQVAGTPELGQACILERIESATRRLRDVTKGFSGVFHLTPAEAATRYFSARQDGLRAPEWQQVMSATV
jgi:hypothetical protein